MEEGLFRAELEAVARRYGYLIWRRCRRISSPGGSPETTLRRVFEQIAASGGELRGREDKLGWLYAVVDAETRSPPSDGDWELEAWHAGDRSATARARAETDPEARELITELDQAKASFASEVDLAALIDGVHRDEPAPKLRSHRAIVVLSIGILLLAAMIGLVAPESTPAGFIPERFAVTLIVDRDGTEQRLEGPRVELRGGDRVQVELSIPTKRTSSVLVLERDGNLTPLAVGRLFAPGIHRLPQTLFIDEKRPLVARLFAGPPALVRTATSNGAREEVLTITIGPEVQ